MTGEEANAAAAVVTVALGTAKKQSQEAGKAKRLQKAKEKREQQAADEGAEDDDTATEDCGDSTPPTTPDSELPTATRTMLTIHRPARRSQLATREQRRGTTTVMTVVSKRRRSVDTDGQGELQSSKEW